MIQSVNFKQAKQLLDTYPNAVFLDVREEEEYMSGHALDAHLCPLGTIDKGTAEMFIPDKETPVLVYCRTGRRSHQAAQVLEGLGYTALYDLGSLAGWPYGITYGLE